jgi:predicted ATPase/DNA-binding SARP family transcriptional activator
MAAQRQRSGAPAPPAPDRVSIWLLGGFRVSRGAAVIDAAAWRLRRAAALVKVLALAPGHRLHREQVIDALWPGTALQSASNSLHQVLYFVRRTVERVLAGAAAEALVRLDGDAIALGGSGGVWTDVDAFEAAAVAARGSSDPAAIRDALRLYVGDLLPDDPYEDWAQAPREALKHTRRGLRMELAARHEQQGHLREAAATLHDIVGDDPAHEPAHAALMRVFALAGRPEDAAAQYRRLRDLLLAEVGADPDASTTRLLEDIQAGRIAAVGPPVRGRFAGARRARRSRVRVPVAPRSTTGNLPTPLTSFVGRERELQDLGDALARARLVTLLGPGGIGKTRLALRVAADTSATYPDGTWFVDLAALSDPLRVSGAVAMALGVQAAPAVSEASDAGDATRDALRRHLQRRRLLLILDNCEHVRDEAADLVVDLLGAGAGLTVLATSREALDVHGEAKWPVPPLSVPPRAARSLYAMETFDAVRLFVERGLLARPGFRLTNSNAASIVELCRRLDQLPLAIELAAARLNTLSPSQLLARVPKRLDLLGGRSRGAPERQQTLRATVAWSYRSLPEATRRFFDRCSVFAGGFTLEAAEAVAADPGSDDVVVIGALSDLVDKSMVIIDEAAGGHIRYRLLETLREFGRERLGAIASAVQEAHARFFMAWAEREGLAAGTGAYAGWLDRLEVDYDNMRAAVQWAVGRGDAHLALRLADALTPLWSDRGPISDGRALLEGALALPAAQAPTSQRADALVRAGRLAWTQGAYPAARALVEDGLTISRGLGDRAGVARGLRVLGPILRVLGDYATARAASEESLAIFRALGDEAGQSNVLQNLGMMSVSRGDGDDAQRLFEEKLAIDRRLGDRRMMAFALIGLGFVAWQQARLDEAARLFEECLRLRREVGDWIGVARALNELGDLSLARGDLTAAQASLTESLAIAQERGIANASRPLGSLGRLALKRGDLETARAHLGEYLRLAREMNDRDDLIRALQGCAVLAAQTGDAVRALRLGGAADALSDRFRAPALLTPDADFDEALAAVRAGIGRDAAATLWAEGSRMSLDHAAALALEGRSRGPAPRRRARAIVRARRSRSR